MNVGKLSSALFLISALSISPVFADDDDDDDIHTTCSEAAINAAEAYDPGSSEFTHCIGIRDEFKVVMAWNSSASNGNILRNTGQSVGQQVVNARNLTRDYANNYGMQNGDEYEMVVVAYAGGLNWLKKDNDVADINMVKALMEQGIKIYACQNTMRGRNLKLADLIDGVEIVPAGVSAVIDFSNRGYTALTP